MTEPLEDRTLVAAITLFITTYLTSQLVVASVTSELNSIALTVSYGLLIMAVAISLTFACRQTGLALHRVVGWRGFSKRSLLFVPLVLLAMFASLRLIQILVLPWWPLDPDAVNISYRHMLSNSRNALAFLLIASVAAPVVEELYFRGFLQNQLCQRWGPLRAIVASATLFAVLHPWSQLPMTFTLGCWLGWAYWRFGLVNSIMLHALWNTLGVLILVDPNGVFS